MADDFNELFDTNAQWVDPQDSAQESPLDTPGTGNNMPPAPDSRMARRRRLEMKHKLREKHMIMALVIILVVVVLCAGGFFGYRTVTHLRANSQSSTQSEVVDYPGPGTGSVSFSINTGESVASVAARLQKAGVVKSADLFTSAVSANNSTLFPGTYELKKHMSSVEVVKILSDQTKASGLLQVKSGERSSQAIDDAAKLSGIDHAQFDQLVSNGGQGVLPPEAKGSFEGWFEPGDYVVKGKTNAAEVLKQMVDKRVAKLDELKVPTGASREQTLIIASIAESEVNSQEYYGKVSRVILNRIDKGMPLGMDSTVAYGANVKPSGLTDAMLADASNPYNTRILKGFPPTPISSPGDDALEAAMNPEPGDWIYFVTTNLKTGETKFTDSEAEFEQLREEYKDSNPDAN